MHFEEEKNGFELKEEIWSFKMRIMEAIFTIGHKITLHIQSL
jgi:hypothetical protein